MKSKQFGNKILGIYIPVKAGQSTQSLRDIDQEGLRNS